MHQTIPWVADVPRLELAMDNVWLKFPIAMVPIALQMAWTSTVRGVSLTSTNAGKCIILLATVSGQFVHITMILRW